MTLATGGYAIAEREAVLVDDVVTSPLTAAEQLDAIGQAVITTTPDGVIVYWNAAAERLYGWSAEDVLGRNIAEVTVPQVGQQIAEDIMAALNSGTAWSGGFPVCRKDGSLFPALVTDAPVERDGRLVGIVGVSTNLGTALQPLLERSTDAALVLRSDAVVAYASPAVRQLFGWHAEDLVGCSIIPFLHPEDRAALADFLAEVVATPGAHPPLELRVRSHESEEWTWAEAALTNLLDDPVVRGVVCNLRRAVRREALAAAEEKARQLQTALDSRVLIEQAKGFLSSALDVTPEAAFERLRGYARSNHLRVHDVAARVVCERLTDLPE